MPRACIHRPISSRERAYLVWTEFKAISPPPKKKNTAMATSLGSIAKNVRSLIYTIKYLSYGGNFAKIGPVNPEIVGLQNYIKRIGINAHRTYSSPGRQAKRVK